ncbi:uncharacterized protein ACNLHF_025975 [Anomaloglossus baeobatrachus]|uniref:uncharacterized protein LOC142245347 n=1 Tax=Anomaloglossus baeobatrachus TaxID=238106 RepID=UPI003F50B908
MHNLLRVSIVLLSVIHFNLALPIAENDSAISLLSNDICPTLNCGSEYMTVTFLKSDLIRLKLDINSIHLIDRSCVGFNDGDNRISIRSPTKVGECRTYVIINGTHAVYKNNIYLKPDPSVVIYREDYMVNFSCIYPLTMDVSLKTVLRPIINTKIFEVTGKGQFEVTMAIFKDPAYVTPREDGDILSTRDMLYVGVMITKGDTAHFNLVLRNCFATPTSNFQNLLKYYIIKDSCKNHHDNTIHVAANGIASYGQFSVQAFQFIAGHGQIYLHCQVHLCENSGSCIPVCNAGGSSGGDDHEDPDDYITLGVPIKEPDNLCPDLQCGASYINVTFQRNDLINSNVDVPKLQTNILRCHDFYEDGNIVSVGWPLGGENCGTTLITNNTHAVYKNSIYLPPIPSQIIYRTAFYVNVSCIYPLNMNVSLHNVLNPMIRTIVIPIVGVGRFEVTMAAFQDQAYNYPYTEDQVYLSTRKRLFIGVFISRGDTRQFDLVMQHCYATPSQNPSDPINYGIIVDSCANDEDGTIEIYANGISSEGKFSILMFKFLNHDRVYLHCKVYLCSKTSGSCVPSCPRPEFRSAAPPAETITFGPIYRSDDNVIPSDITKVVTDEPTSDDPRVTKPENTPVDPTATAVNPEEDNAADTSTVIMKTTSGYADNKRTCLDLLTLIAILMVTLIL